MILLKRHLRGTTNAMSLPPFGDWITHIFEIHIPPNFETTNASQRVLKTLMEKHQLN
jgi:hypothetical protein